MKKVFFPTAFVLIIFVAIGSSGIENKISRTDIKGTWFLNKWTTYHTLTFDDSTITVDNNIDTIFTLSYLIKDNSLITVTQYGNKMMINKINKLTVDSLVLEGIHNIKEKRIYTRTRKD